MNEPTTFRAGDSVSWAETLADYPPTDGWSLAYRLLWPTGAAVNIATTADGDDYLVELTSANTVAWAAGQATLVAVASRGVERATLGSKQVTILPDLTVATTHDGRSANRKALDQAEAAMAAYLAGGKAHVAEYEIAGRKIKFRAIDEIQSLINYYKRLVAKENAYLALLEGGSVPGRVHYRG